MRPHHEEDPRDDQQPQPPPLMGGDGSHGPGVAVASTEQPRREENVDDETVTLQLQNPSSNDDNPILCSIVCNRRAIRTSSALIRNLLDNIARDYEVLPPFSTEHIADELTLRRVVAFVTDVEPTIPEGQLTEECFLNYGDGDEGEAILLAPTAADFGDNVRQMIRKFVQVDSHRGGILKMLVAAHYLGCEKLTVATAGYLAIVINAWCNSDQILNIFGDDPVLGTPEDPVAKVPLHVLAEITNLFMNFARDGLSVLKFSPTMFKSIAQVERIWESDFSDHKYLDLDNPFCHVALSFEQRLEHDPDCVIDVFNSNFCHGINSYHARWKTLVDRLATNFAKGLVHDGLPYCRNRKTLAGLRNKHSQHTNLFGMDLSSPFSASVAVAASVAKIDPFFTALLPPLPTGGVDAIADCWKEYYHFVTHKATSVSVQIGMKNGTRCDTKELERVCSKNLNIHTVEITVRNVDHEDQFCPRSHFTDLLEAAMIEHVIIPTPHLLGSLLPSVLPFCMKRLELHCLNTHDANVIMDRCFGDVDRKILLNELVVLNASSEVANVIVTQLRRLHVGSLYESERALRIFLGSRVVFSALNTYELVAEFRPHIEFMLLDYFDGWRRMPSCKDEGKLRSTLSWEKMAAPTFKQSL